MKPAKKSEAKVEITGTPKPSQNDSSIERVAPDFVFTTFRTHLLDASRVDKNTDEQNPLLSKHAILGFDEHIKRLISNSLEVGFAKQENIDSLRRQVIAHLTKAFREYLQTHSTQTAKNNSEFKFQPLRLRLAIDSKLVPSTRIEPYTPPWPADSAIKLKSVEACRNLPKIKSSYIESSLLAREKAEEDSAQEALLCEPQTKIVREGAWSNFFWVDATGMIHTPKSNLLPGVTREFILQRFDCHETEISLEQLIDQAQEVFITQSTSGITAVSKIDGHQIGIGAAGPRTKEVIKYYKTLVRTEAKPIVI